jgi:hypothetical protein
LTVRRNAYFSLLFSRARPGLRPSGSSKKDIFIQNDYFYSPKEEKMFSTNDIQKWISSLDEHQFRTLVLIPLFKALGYQSVYHYHGGAREIGKDIVMWKNDDFRNRENTAVVVKSGTLTGSVTGKGSVSEVFIQVQQALGSKYKDQISGEEQKIHKCLVVTSLPVSKNVVEALRDAWEKSSINQFVKILDCSVLVDYLIIHNITPYSIELMIDTFSKLNNNKLQKITLEKNDNRTTVSINVSSNGTKEDLVGEFGFEFTDDEESKRTMAQLTAFEEKGESVEIDKKFIKKFRLPSIFENIGISSNVDKIVLGPALSDEVWKFDFKILNNENVVGEMQNLEFNIEARGSKQTKINNKKQNLPFIFELTFTHEMKLNFHFSYNVKLESTSAYELNIYNNFLYALSEGGHILIFDSKTKTMLSKMAFPRDIIKRPNSLYMDIVKMLAFIQTEINEPIFFPKKGISEEEYNEILRTYKIMKEGILDPMKGTLEMTFIPTTSERFRFETSSEEQELNIVFRTNYTTELLNHHIYLGIAEIMIPKGIISVKDITETEKSVTIALNENSNSKAVFEKYLKRK